MGDRENEMVTKPHNFTGEAIDDYCPLCHGMHQLQWNIKRGFPFLMLTPCM